MEVCTQCQEKVPAALVKNGICVLCAASKQDTVDKLKARIAELELELQRLKTATEKGDKLLRVMWGDDFNDDSLH